MSLRIHGVVLHAATREGLSGWTVRLHFELGARADTHCAADGSFDFAPLEATAAPVRVELVAPGLGTVLAACAPLDPRGLSDIELELCVAGDDAPHQGRALHWLDDQPHSPDAVRALDGRELYAAFAWLKRPAGAALDPTRVRAALPALEAPARDADEAVTRDRLLRRLLAQRGIDVSNLAADRLPVEADVRTFETRDVRVSYTSDEHFLEDRVDPRRPAAHTDLVVGGRRVGQLSPDVDAPSRVQRAALVAQHALERLLAPPWSLTDPRASTRRAKVELYFGATGPAARVLAGGARHVVLAPALDGERLDAAVARSLFELCVARAGAWDALHFGAGVLFECELVARPLSAAERALPPGASVESRGDGRSASVRSSGAALWSYLADVHGQEPNPRAAVARLAAEACALAGASAPRVSVLRAVRGWLAGPGSFDEPGSVPERVETVWGNLAVAAALSAAGIRSDDARFAPRALLGGAPSNALARVRFARGSRNLRRTSGVPPWSTRAAWIAFDAQAAPRTVLLATRALGGLSDALVHLALIGRDGTLRDVLRTWPVDARDSFAAHELSGVLVCLAARSEAGEFEIGLEELDAAPDVFLTPADCNAGSELEVDPRAFAWTWLSPDVELQAATAQSPARLAVRVRNRGALEARDVSVSARYQACLFAPDAARWRTLTDEHGAPAGARLAHLAPGAQAWLELPWAPENAESTHGQYVVEVQVEAATAAGTSATSTTTARRVRGSVARVGVRRVHPHDDPNVIELAPQEHEGLRNAELVVVSRSAARSATSRATSPGAWRIECGPSAAPLPRGTPARRPEAARHYAAQRAALPPGVMPEQLVTALCWRDGELLGGASWALPR